jgi:hypothetical protein
VTSAWGGFTGAANAAHWRRQPPHWSAAPPCAFAERRPGIRKHVKGHVVDVHEQRVQEPSDTLVLRAAYVYLFSDDVPLDQDGGNARASGVLRGEQQSDIDMVSAWIVFRFR